MLPSLKRTDKLARRKAAKILEKSNAHRKSKKRLVRAPFEAKTTPVAQKAHPPSADGTVQRDVPHEVPLTERADTVELPVQGQTEHQYGIVNVSGSGLTIVGDVVHHHHYHLYVSNTAHSSWPITPSHRYMLPTEVDPNDLFEKRPTYRPEAYTLQSLAPKLYAYSWRRLGETTTHRLDQFSVLYSPDSKKRVRVTISLITSMDSDLWHFMKYQTTLRTSYAPLPYCLVAKMKGCLETIDDGMAQDSHYMMLTNKNAIRDGSTSTFRQQVEELSRLCFRMPPKLRQLTADFPHWDCPWFNESDIERIPLVETRRSHQFLAWVNSRWVMETRLSPEPHLFRSQTYTMKALHQLNGLPGLVPFHGVIRNDSGTIVSYLTELPSKGQFQSVMAGGKVSQPQREKWCKQIIQTVAGFHHRNLVVGMLGAQHDPTIGIDGNSGAILCAGFCTDLAYQKGELGNLPPECRPYTKSARSTLQTDLYQLGLVLWRIAGNKTRLHRTEFCSAAACTTRPDTVCREPHTDPVSLPMPTDEYPEHLRQIISSCRAENPNDRIPAHKLLLLFPQADDISARPEQLNESNPHYFPRPEVYHKLYSYVVNCDLCGGVCTEHYFSCHFCKNGNFDLCQACFARGRHCSDDTHYLQEFPKRFEEDKFYANVKSSGKREIMTPADLDFTLM